MKHTTARHRLPLLVGLIAIGIEPTSAADWTRSTDLTAPGYESSTVEGNIGVTDAALWLNPSTPVDPRTGADVSVHALPERISINFDEPAMSAVSSQRGLLWNRGQDDDVRTEADVQGSTWSLHQDLFLRRIAADGAQVRTWTGADFGANTARIASVQLLSERNGVIIVLRTPSSAGDTAETLWLDPKGAVLSRRQAPTCTTAAYDDRAGGFYALCANGAASTVQRFGAAAANDWSTPATLANPDQLRVTSDGGVLVRCHVDALFSWRHIDAQGGDRFSHAGTFAAETRLGFWIAEDTPSQHELVYVDRAGNELARTTLTGAEIIGLVAHRDGSALTAVYDPWSTFWGSMVKTVHGANGQTLRRVLDHNATEGRVSRLRFDRGLPHAISTDLPGHATLIDDRGQDISAPFPYDNPVGRVLADAQHVCVESGSLEGDGEGGFMRRVTCYDRHSGERRGDVLGSASPTEHVLLGVNGWVSVRVSDRISVFTPNGLLVNDIPLGARPFNRFDFDAAIGTAVIDPLSDLSHRLRRYATNGSLVADVALTYLGSVVPTDVRLSPDGSMFVFTRSQQARVTRHAADGSVLGGYELGSGFALHDLAGASVTASGVQLLLQPFSGFGTLDSELLVLSPDLGELRARHVLGKNLISGLWPSGTDDPWIVTAREETIAIRRFASGTGSLRSRVVLPKRNAVQVDPRRADAFAIDPDGDMRLLDHDSILYRHVLRSYAPTTAFNGRVGQTALAGSWYAPASTGQGLIVELLNGGRQLFAAWHTFAPEGGNLLSKQQWLSVQGTVGAARGAITLPIYRNSGGRFDVVGMTDAVAVGSAELVFTGCDRMEFWYRIGDEVGALPLQRLTPRTQPCDNGTSIEAAADTAAAIDLSGPWYDPSRSGQGLAVSASGTQFNQFFAGWFTYDAENASDDPDAQHWFSVQGANPARYGEPVSARIYRTVGGSRSGEPTRNTHAVGSAQLTVHDCGHATLEYVFDDSAVAGPFANQSRSVPLVRLGSCSD